MSEYTPTTEEIREEFAFDDWDNDPAGPDRARARFDRWLAAHDAEVRAAVSQEDPDTQGWRTSATGCR